MTCPNDAAIAIHRRRDLVVERVTFRGKAAWAVKDPLTLRYYQLRDEEYFVLNQLDGKTSLEQVCARFQRRFAPHRIDRSQLNWFLGTLHREALVVSDGEHQSQRLLERRRRSVQRQRRERLTNLLAIRFRGIDPTRLLDWVHPFIRWMFLPGTVAAAFGLIAVALIWAALHAETVVDKLPTWSTFLSADYLLCVPLAIAAAKVVHELAHALTCKHFGGTCREFGLMLLVLTPCLYCNVSDAWMISSKWRRIAVSSAGIFAELVLAAVAFFVWWSSEPGLLNAVCLSLLVVCSAGTVLFNGNPFLRYDGYFILADLLEIPNLREQAAEVWQQGIASWIFGLDASASPLSNNDSRCLLAIYGAISICFRWLIVGGILLAAYQVLAAYRLEWAAVALAVVVMGGMLAGPTSQAAGILRNPRRRQQVRWGRASFVLLLAAAAIGIGCLTPLPAWVAAPAILKPVAPGAVYVTVPGRLRWAVSEGDRVENGDVIAELTNFGVANEIVDLTGQVRRQQLTVNQLQTRSRFSAGEPELAARIPAASDALVDLEQRLSRRQAALHYLTLRAPRNGIVMASRRQVPTDSEDTELGWTGSPLDVQARDCYLDRDTEICVVAEPDQLEVQLIIPESDIGVVRKGQRVRLRFPSSCDADLSGSVKEVSASVISAVPRELVVSGLVATRIRDDGSATAEPANPSYQVKVELDPGATSLPVHSTGRAKISVEPSSLAHRVHSYLHRTFAK